MEMQGTEQKLIPKKIRHYTCGIMLLFLGSFCFSCVLIRVTDHQTQIILSRFDEPKPKAINTKDIYLKHEHSLFKNSNLRQVKSQTKIKKDFSALNFIKRILPNNSYSYKDSWTFLGDSTMYRLFNSFKRLQTNCKKIKSSGRCNFWAYLGVRRRENWVRPTTTEGPLLFGLTHPYCTDCSGCNSIQLSCRSKDIEYLSVEFARDVEIQSTTTNTTQESVSFYLSLKPRNRCIVNSGLHDLAIFNLTDSQYVNNVRQYLDLLQTSCKRIFWLSTTAVKGNQKFPQENRRIYKWNKDVEKMILKRKFQNIKIIDVFDISNFPTLHVDNVHLKGTFYRKVAKNIMFIN